MWRQSTIALALLVCTNGVAASQPATQPLQIVNTLPAFDEVATKVGTLEEKDRVQAFERLAAPIADGFYARSRSPEKYDGRIGKGLASYPEKRATILLTAEQFDAAFHRALPKFEKVFGPVESERPIYVINSFGEMDGGTRDLQHGSTLLFGADVIARIHTPETMEPFLDHEIFHLWHGKRFDECDPAWCSLWEEGLATYVAAALNPDAGDKALLLDSPAPIRPEVDKDRAGAVCATLPIMPSEDEEQYAKLFFGSSHVDGFPARMGYYIGYLVVEDLARTHTLAQLAQLSPKEVEPLVKKSLKAMAPSCPAKWD